METFKRSIAGETFLDRAATEATGTLRTAARVVGGLAGEDFEGSKQLALHLAANKARRVYRRIRR